MDCQLAVFGVYYIGGMTVPYIVYHEGQGNMITIPWDNKRCEEICKYAPPEKGKWPCMDCDLRWHDRAEPPEKVRCEK